MLTVDEIKKIPLLPTEDGFETIGIAKSYALGGIVNFCGYDVTRFTQEELDKVSDARFFNPSITSFENNDDRVLVIYRELRMNENHRNKLTKILNGITHCYFSSSGFNNLTPGRSRELVDDNNERVLDENQQPKYVNLCGPNKSAFDLGQEMSANLKYFGKGGNKMSYHGKESSYLIVEHLENIVGIFNTNTENTVTLETRRNLAKEMIPIYTALALSETIIGESTMSVYKERTIAGLLSNVDAFIEFDKSLTTPPIFDKLKYVIDKVKDAVC